MSSTAETAFFFFFFSSCLGDEPNYLGTVVLSYKRLVRLLDWALLMGIVGSILSINAFVQPPCTFEYGQIILTVWIKKQTVEGTLTSVL